MTNDPTLPFDAFEVATCVPIDIDYPGAPMTSDEYEALDEWDDKYEGDPTVIYTVYGHRTTMGVVAIGDFQDPDTAFNMAQALANTGNVPLYNRIVP